MSPRRFSPATLSGSALILALLISASMWFYVQRILISHQKAESALHGIPRGNLSDLYPRWLGARELLLHHRDPYSEDITREIQMGYYGRALNPSRPFDPIDQQGFAYPLYVVFLLAPTIWLPFSIVQVGFRWFLIILTAASVPIWLRILRWRISCTAIATAILLTLGSFQVLQAIKLQQLSLLVSGLIAASVVFIAQGWLVAAGILLALAGIKPQLILLVSAWLLLWTAGDWRHRQGFAWGFLLTLAALFGASDYVLPGWVARFWNAVLAYREYNAGAGSVLDELITPGSGKALAALIVLALAVLCWRLRQTNSDQSDFLWGTALVLAVTVVVVPKAAPYNQILLLPAVLLVLRDRPAIWNKNRLARLCCAAAGIIFAWPWLAALALTLASLFLPAHSVQQAWAAPVYTSLAIPIAVAALLVLDAPRDRSAHSAQ
jgi:Glycosyltransferase family 87